jgi:hypothetical protein
MSQMRWGSAPRKFLQILALSSVVVAPIAPAAHAATAVDAAATPSTVAPSAELARPAGVPSEAELVALLRATLAKVDYGDKTGDYHGLYAQLTPQVQKVVDLPRLASALEGFRKLRVDMGAVARTEPLYDRPPELTPDGSLLLRGSFPTNPREIRFDFEFVRTAAEWRIQALNLDTPGTAVPSASRGTAAGPQTAAAPQAAAPQAAAPQPTAPQTLAPETAAASAAQPHAVRKVAVVESPFLDRSTDPPTASKW